MRTRELRLLKMWRIHSIRQNFVTKNSCWQHVEALAAAVFRLSDGLRLVK